MTTTTLHFTRPPTPHPETELWQVADVEALFALPFMELVFRAAEVHRQFFDPNKVQLSTLLSIKTGGCSEDCGYCPQSVHHDTAVADEPMLSCDDVVAKARQAKAAGAGRFCMGAAWRGPKDADLERTLAMIADVKALGLETCATFGLLADGQAERLKAVLSRFAVADPEAQVDVLLARRTLEQARADLDRAEADLEKAVVRAPVSGTVLKIMARAGERASNSGILRLADLSVMTVDVEVYQSDISRVKPGDAVEISSSALPRMLKGKVERIGLEVGRQTLVDAGPAANTDARVVIATVSLLPEDREIAARFTNLQVTARIQPQGEAASP